jgi:hypothetical protein
MEGHSSGEAMAALAEATAIQTEVAYRRLALEWGQRVFALALEVWSHIEDHETLAYEDKVGAQVRVFQQASTNLWHLQRELARTCRLLKGHQRQLKRHEPVGREVVIGWKDHDHRGAS